MKRSFATKICLLLLILAFPQGVNKAFAETNWTGCGITKKAFMAELAKSYKQETKIEIQIFGGGATKGLREVASGKSKIGGTCRHTLDVPEENTARLYPVAWDALVIVTHKDNPISGLSSSQLNKVFAGTITQWKELGTSKNLGKINLHVRQGKISGVGLMSRLLIFYDQDMEYHSTHTHHSTGPLEEALSADPSGIAITGISSAVRRPGLKILSLDGVQPSAENILNGTYELIRPLYLAIKEGNEKSGTASDFVKYALSADGQKIIANTGTVPMAKVGDSLFKKFHTKMAKAKQRIAQLKLQEKASRDFLNLSLEELINVNLQ